MADKKHANPDVEVIQEANEKLTNLNEAAKKEAGEKLTQKADDKSKDKDSSKGANSHHGKKRKRQKLAKHIFSLILSFIFSVCLSCMIILVGCKYGVFNSDILMTQLNKTNYYGSIGNEISKNMENLLMPTGLPASVLEGVFDDSRVYIDAKNSIEAALMGKEYNVNSVDIKEQFITNINDYIAKENIKKTAETDAGIDALFSQMMAQYESQLSLPFIDYFVKYSKLYNKYYTPVVLTLLGVMIVSAFAMIKMQSWAHKGIRYIAYGTMASFIVTGITPTAVLLSGIYEKINISPQYMYNLLVGVMEADITMFIYLSLAVLMIFAAELVAISMLKKRVRYK